MVKFNVGKENLHIILKIEPIVSEFKLLGVEFDYQLIMNIAVHECVISALWKLKSILRTRRFFNSAELIRMFKTHILSFIESRSPAFSHASTSILQPLDDVLKKFLKDLGISFKDAILHFNLAPLSTRRDIATLGIIHRAILR